MAVDPKRLVALDFEASCLPSAGRSYPIEVGLAWVATGETRTWLIRPAAAWASWTWDAVSQAVHGIERELLEAVGKPVDVVARELLEAVGDGQLVSDAARLDGLWLATLLNAAGIAERPPVLDLESVLDDLSDGGLAGAGQVDDAINEARRRYPKAIHRADADARRTAEAIRILAGLAK